VRGGWAGEKLEDKEWDAIAQINDLLGGVTGSEGLSLVISE
jgi:hypothetical protein